MLHKLVAKQFPNLRLTLAQARITETPDEYIKKTTFVSMLLAISISVVGFLFTKNVFLFLAFPLTYAVSFFYFLNTAQAKIAAINKDISKEIVFAGRFLIIELESGVPVYESFQNLSKNYEHVGKYFSEVVDRVDLGTPMEEALNEAVQLSPSNDLRRIFWQVLNSLKTGSEVAGALSNVFDQIVREQQIRVKEYGRKLNPLAMFYMMAAIIIPSLGTIMLIVLSTFIGINMSLVFFFIIIGLNIIVQLLFLAIIRAQRPPVDI
ncbi:MAG: type II secretion system F family protein [Candidatus Woesearchaeota archaeon]|nr:type II secretion system F family protein [Candidatus Woesearchaeota archaeon]